MRRCAGHPRARARRRDGPHRRQGRERLWRRSSARDANGIVTTQSLDDVLATQPDAAIHSGMLVRRRPHHHAAARGRERVHRHRRLLPPRRRPSSTSSTPPRREGDASFTAGGNIPGLISDVFPLFLTGYTGRIRQIRARQANDVSTYPSGPQIQSLGIGKDIARRPGDGRRCSTSASPPRSGNRRTWSPTASASSAPTACSPRSAWSLAEEDIVLPSSGLLVAAGTVAGIEWTWAATAGRPGVPARHQPADRRARPRAGLARAPRGPAVAGRDRRRAVDHRHVRVAAGLAAGRVDARCSTCRAR